MWVLDLATGRKRTVAEVASPRNPGTAVLAWTGDSRQLIVEDRTSNAEPSGLFLLGVDDGEKERLTLPPAGSEGDRLPALSQDGRKLAFVRVLQYGVDYIYLMDIGPDGLPRSEPLRLTRRPAEITDILWAGGRKEILFATDGGSMRQLWRTSISTPAPREIASSAPPGFYLALSHRGDRLSYTNAKVDDDIWRLDLNDKDDHTGHPFLWSTLPDQNPHISMDGRKIAFDSLRSGEAQIWVSDSDGSHVRQLTSSGCSAGTPRWSPEGREIAFDCNLDGNYEIHAIDASGGDLRRLTANPAIDVLPRWSRDGRSVYFSSNRSGKYQIWKMSSAGGQPAQITKEGGFGGVQSTDGTLFYYAKSPNKSIGIWSVPAWGGEEIEIDGRLRSWPDFTVSEKGIYFSSTEPAPFAVQFYHFRTRQISTVRTVTTRIGTGFAVAPGAQWMLFAARQFTGGDLVMVENLP